jgi:hypothetical protein
MYRLKRVAFRTSALVATLGLLGSTFAAAIMPMVANADALNPLTQRSLTLSSSSPGWSYTDGSGDPWDISCYPYTPPGPNTCAPGYSPYAYPGSGANGQKTGETFSFDVSTNSSASGTNAYVNAMTFQYCTTSAGTCLAPGDNGWNDTATPGTYVSNANSSTTSNFNVVTNSPTELSSGQYNTAITAASTTGNLASGQSIAPDDSDGTFVVETKDVGQSDWSYSPGWTMSTTNLEDAGTEALGTATGANNLIKLVNSTAGLKLQSTGGVKVIFFATNDNYITNPGDDAFFVKINDYDSTTDIDPMTSTHIVDGGVTVANVMNQSIQIETKVLETMDFSVGTVDPDTINDTQLHAATGQSTHGICDPVLTSMTPTGNNAQNFLLLGNQNAESSLSTTHTYGTYSYFRLSSNSTGGATVYYAGATLSDTEGDQINAIGTSASAPHPGTPQFGLALDNDTNAADTGTYDSAGTTEGVDFGYNNTSAGDATDYENSNDGFPAGIDSSFTTDTGGNGDVHNPRLYPLVPATAYADGTGVFDAFTTAAGYTPAPSTSFPVDTQFAFDSQANTIPAILASESTHVVDCITGKVRYIANIAATTPAGIYTTKINYIASPQY